ncbi:Nucleoporin POM33, partial [Trametes pubescens]
TPQPNTAWVQRALLDENIQYFIMAFFWWSSKPVTFALVPYAIFSLFHALTFTRTTLLPQFLPAGPPPQAGAAPTPHPIAKKLQVWVKTNYDNAMRIVAFTELAILGRVLFGALLFRNAFITPILYAYFLRQRWFQSKFTRDAVGTVHARIHAFVTSPGKPPVVAQVYTQVTNLVGRWAGSLPGAGPNGAAAGAGAGARRQ